MLQALALRNLALEDGIVVRYVKNGRYIDLGPDKTIISFGAR
jgi:hypothetical protein